MKHIISLCVLIMFCVSMFVLVIFTPQGWSAGRITVKQYNRNLCEWNRYLNHYNKVRQENLRINKEKSNWSRYSKSYRRNPEPSNPSRYVPRIYMSGSERRATRRVSRAR